MTPSQPRHQWLKGIGIGIGALILSTLVISASDVTQGVRGLMSGALLDSQGPCGDSAILERFGQYALCIDRFEAAPSAACTYLDPKNELETIANLSDANCKSESAIGRPVWRFVTYTQAQQLCARAGKRLPTAQEWYRITLPLTNIDSCTVAKTAPEVTGGTTCTTPSGIHDLVGNVWEWMNDTVTEGQINGRNIPPPGYVDLVDDAGLVLRTATTSNESFGNDYAWTDQAGVRGILRGGFYQSGSDGGLFSQNLSVALDFQAAGVGFRCVQDVE
jgi:hypothetical protein